MKNKVLILLLSLLGVISCHREETPASGSLRIVFETGAAETKAGDGDVADGGGIAINDGTPDLVVLIANTSTGSIAAAYPSGAAIVGELEGDPASTTVSVSFNGLIGSTSYTVYTFANTQGLWNMSDNLGSISTASAVEALQFTPIAADKESDGSLVIKNSRLPLSAKGEVTLSSLGNGEITLPLKRCVAKVTAVFENQYGEDLTLYDFTNTFYHMLPSTGYVIPHGNDFPVAKADAEDLTASESSISIQNNQSYSMSWYVFPSIGPYSCDVSFYLNSHSDSEDPTYDPSESTNPIHEYSNLPVHDDHARDITQLARNQHLTITTRIGKGKQVSFNFEVQDWGEKTESVTFN